MSVRNRDKLATGMTLSPLVSRCHGVTLCLFSRGSQGLGFFFFLSEAPFHSLYSVLLSVQQIGSTEVTMSGLSPAYWGSGMYGDKGGTVLTAQTSIIPTQMPSVSSWDAQGL